MDPITLELSMFFHPSTAASFADEAAEQNATKRAEVDAYAAQFKVGEFIIARRRWAHAVAAGDREVYASVYAYVLRQLTYTEANKAVALALLREIVRALKATY